MRLDCWQRVKDLPSSVLDLAPEKWEEHLSVACAGDQELRSEFERPLARSQEAAGFPESPAIEMAARELAGEQHATPDADFLGGTLPQYRIAWKIGARADGGGLPCP